MKECGVSSGEYYFFGVFIFVIEGKPQTHTLRSLRLRLLLYDKEDLPDTWNENPKRNFKCLFRLSANPGFNFSVTPLHRLPAPTAECSRRNRVHRWSWAQGSDQERPAENYFTRAECDGDSLRPGPGKQN